MKYILLFIILCVFLFGCRPLIETPIPDECLIPALLLDQTVFPEGTFASTIMSPLPDGSKESGGIDFYYKGDGAIHQVNNYSTTYYAIQKYKREIAWVFADNKNRGPWKKPELSFLSRYADNLDYECGFLVDTYKCEMTARYDKYYTWFSMDISKEGFRLENFEQAMIEIDKRMGRCIQNK